MKLTPKLVYTIEIDAHELRLINTALRGSLKEEQNEAAGELSNELCRQRVEQTRTILNEVEKLEGNLKRS